MNSVIETVESDRAMYGCFPSACQLGAFTLLADKLYLSLR